MLSRREVLAMSAALGVATTSALAANPADDIAILRRAYETLHPGLYRYAAPATITARFDALDRVWRQAPSLSARYLLLSRFLATVRCGHTYANFYNQKVPVRDALFARHNRLPFLFRWLGTRMIVTADPANVGLRPGDEIVAIDGRPAPAILAALLTVARADGHNDAKRRMLMSVQAIDRYESFDIYYPLLFPAGDRFRLEVRSPGGAIRTQIVDAIGLDQRRAQRSPEPKDDGKTPLWQCEIDGSVALMTMPSWGLYDSKWNWRGWLDAQFEAIASAGANTLILDLRRNEGGEDCGVPIIARRITRPIPFSDERRLVRYRRVPDDLIPYLDTWDTRFRELGKDATAAGPGWFRLPDEGDDMIQPAAKPFAGRMIVLVSPENSSATFQFANLVKRQRLGILIGEPTGGNLRGINGGCFFFLRLPGSGLEADLPLIGRFPATPQPDSGLMPDIAVIPTAADIAAARDPVMERARMIAMPDFRLLHGALSGSSRLASP